MKGYEYETLIFDDLVTNQILDKELNRWARMGWKLVTAVSAGGFLHYTLARERTYYDH